MCSYVSRVHSYLQYSYCHGCVEFFHEAYVISHYYAIACLVNHEITDNNWTVFATSFERVSHGSCNWNQGSKKAILINQGSKNIFCKTFLIIFSLRYSSNRAHKLCDQHGFGCNFNISSCGLIILFPSIHLLHDRVIFVADQELELKRFLFSIKHFHMNKYVQKCTVLSEFPITYIYDTCLEAYWV